MTGQDNTGLIWLQVGIQKDRIGWDGTGQVRICHDSTRQEDWTRLDISDRIGQDRTGQDKAIEGRAGQDRTGQDKIFHDKTKEDKTRLDWTGRTRIGRDRAIQDCIGN